MRFLYIALMFFLVACQSDKVQLAFGTVLDSQNYILQTSLDVWAISPEGDSSSEHMRTDLKVASTLTQLIVYDDGSAKYELHLDSVEYSSDKRSVEEVAYMEKYLRTQTFRYKIRSNGIMDTIFPMEEYLAIKGVNDLQLPRLFVKLQPVLPEKNVSIGESWDGAFSDSSSGEYTTVYKTFRLEDVFYRGGLQLAKLSMGVRYRKNEEDESVKLESKDYLVGKGMLLFDMTKGQVFSVDLELTGDLIVDDKLNQTKVPNLKVRQVLKMERQEQE